MEMESRRIELKRDLGTWPAMSIVVGTVIGSGIFLVPHTMIQRVGTVKALFVVWIVGGLLSLAGALSYAELAAAIPEAGGEFAYLREAYGPMWGFLYSWTQLWVAKSGSIATLGTGFFLYLTNFFPSLDTVFYSIPLPIGPGGGPLEIRSGQVLAIVLILLLAWLNYYGVKLGGNVQVAVTAVKVALIGFVIIAGLGFGQPHAAVAVSVTALTFRGFIAALVAALWAYDGWNNVSMVSSEIHDPQRNLPLALIGGTLAVIAIYLLANIAYFRVMTPAEVAGGTRVAADMMRRIMDGFGANAVSVAAMISIFAALNGSILSGARVPYAAARQGLFFRSIGNVSPKYRTPGVSIIVLTLWSCLLVLSGRYDDLFNLVIFASWILYGMTAAAVLVLRWKQPALPRPYKTLGYPVVPLLFIFGAIILIVSTAIDRPRESGMGICLILAGLPFYFHWKSRRL
ncbi:Amino acid permease-associated region [Candidatus Sulfopaludibacter sp. SbA3]|nr:Amino acid permease-associated region [Candidatus Sulfopaludibacter sp. SbA3]